MQSYVGIAPAQTGQQRRKQSQKRIQRISSEGAEEQVEPHHVRPELADRSQQVIRAEGIVERPAAAHGETIQLGLSRRYFVGQDCHAQERIAAQFFGNVKAVLAQSPLAGRKSGHQANFHYSPASL